MRSRQSDAHGQVRGTSWTESRWRREVWRRREIFVGVLMCTGRGADPFGKEMLQTVECLLHRGLLETHCGGENKIQVSFHILGQISEALRDSLGQIPAFHFDGIDQSQGRRYEQVKFGSLASPLCLRCIWLLIRQPLFAGQERHTK